MHVLLLFVSPLEGWKPVLPMFVIEQISYSCGPLACAENKPHSGIWVAGLERLSRRVEMRSPFEFCSPEHFPPIYGSCFVLFSINSLLDRAFGLSLIVL